MEAIIGESFNGREGQETRSAHMRILVVHDRYLSPGGEVAVVCQETALLKAHDHDVTIIERHSRD